MLVWLANTTNATPEQKLGSHDCPVPEKPRRRTMTPRLAKRFDGPEVRQYVARLALARRRSTLADVEQPPEYSNIVLAGKDAVPFLLRKLKSHDPVLRGAAFLAIASITNKGFGSNGFPDPATSQPDVQGYEKWWDQNQGKSRIQWLMEDVTSENSSRAQNAIFQLSYEGDPHAIQSIRRVLSNPRLRPYAAEALARLGDKQAVPDVIDTYLSRDEAWMRKDGICLLIHLTGKSFDFDPDATPESRKAAIDRWRVWWQTEGKSLH